MGIKVRARRLAFSVLAVMLATVTVFGVGTTAAGAETEDPLSECLRNVARGVEGYTLARCSQYSATATHTERDSTGPNSINWVDPNLLRRVIGNSAPDPTQGLWSTSGKRFCHAHLFTNVANVHDSEGDGDAPEPTRGTDETDEEFNPRHAAWRTQHPLVQVRDSEGNIVNGQAFRHLPANNGETANNEEEIHYFALKPGASCIIDASAKETMRLRAETY